MLKKNEEYIVDIIDTGYMGEGIAKIENFSVFIEGAVKGEQIKIKILKVLSNFAYGKIIEVIKKSENRTNSDCETFTKCGGCNLRHIKYDTTLKIKEEIVKNCFRKLGLGYVKINNCVGMENPYYYRNKLQYPVSINHKNEKLMGVFASRTHTIIPTNNCFIQNKRTQEIAKAIFEYIKQNNIPVYNEQTLEGEIRHIYIRIGIKTNEIMVVLVTNKKTITKEKELTKYIVNKFNEVKTVIKNINPNKTNVILGKENKVLFGNGYITDSLLGYKFKISPMSFYQVNPIQTEKLYSQAIEYANLTGKETVFDLYCGIGTIAICASKGAKKIYGIETVPEAIKDANENSKINNLKNTEFMVGNVEEILPRFIESNNIKPDVVFIDPPRKGCDKKTLETLISIIPRKIIYVSCNPATLARDLKKLEEKYEIKEVTPFDMFPYTHHVECVAVLQLKQDM